MAPQEQVFVGRPPVVPAGAALTTQAAFFTDGSDNLRIVSVCSVANVTVVVSGRVRREDGTIGRFVHEQRANSDRTVKTSDIGLAPGYILNVTAVAVGANVSIGNCFVIVQIIGGLGGGTIVLGTLIQGYVTSTQYLAWPGSPIQHSLSALPFRRHFQVTNPAVNTDWGFGPATGQRWQVLQIRATLSTGVTGLPRAVQLTHVTGLGQAWQVAPSAEQNDVTGYTYTWAPNLPAIAVAGAAIIQQPIPLDVTMIAGEGVGSNTVGIGGGDQWSSIFITVNEWLEVP